MISLLEKTRKVTELLQQKGSHLMQFTELCNLLSQLLNANTYVFSSKGKVLGENKRAALEFKVGELIETDANNKLLLISETKTNIQNDDLGLFAVEKHMDFLTIIPIICAGERLGTLVIKRENEKYNDEDLVVAEYGAAVVGMEILRSDKEEQDEEERKVGDVKQALGSLSYSEQEAIDNILEEINGTEGIVVASKIADRAGITRSVIVNALRKLESAGVIESRSLGMKGTMVKIINKKLLEEYNKMD